MAKHPTDFIQQNSERTMQTVDVGLNWFRETAADLQAQQGRAGGAAWAPDEEKASRPVWNNALVWSFR